MKEELVKFGLVAFLSIVFGIGCTDGVQNEKDTAVEVEKSEPVVEPEKICEVDGVILWKVKNTKYLREYGSNEYIFFTTGCGKVIDAYNK